MHMRDIHASVLHLFGLDVNRLTFRHAGLAQKLVGTQAPATVVSGILSWRTPARECCLHRAEHPPGSNRILLAIKGAINDSFTKRNDLFTTGPKLPSLTRPVEACSQHA